MSTRTIIRLCDRPHLKNFAAEWFHSKWGIPLEAYLASLEDCIENSSPVPQWYVFMENEKILAGLGVIENDFHDRKDLAPNICAVYVEPEYRCQGLAGELLAFACADMKQRGITDLYLITDHTTFYERYGWEFLCMVSCEGEDHEIRMYHHKE